MMISYLFLLLLCAILISANNNGYQSEKVCNLHGIDTLCNAENELENPHEVLWSNHLSSITLQVKDSEVKQYGKTGKVYRAVRTPTKLMDRQVKKRSTGARKLMKRKIAGADKNIRKGTLFTHKLTRQGLIFLDKHVVWGTRMAHNYLVQTSKSLDDRIVAGTRTTHHKVKHTLLPIDKGIVHGSSRAYATAKKGVTAVDRRIKNGARAMDQQLSSGTMKGLPLKIPVKFFLSSVFKSKGKKAGKSAPALPAIANEPEEPTQVADTPHTENEIKTASAESMKHSAEVTGDDHNSTGNNGEEAHRDDTSMENLKDDETMSNLDTEHEDHDHDHLEDHGDDDHHENLEGIDHMDETDPFEHNHEEGTSDHNHGHSHESMNFDGEPRNVGKKKGYFHGKVRQAVPHASSRMLSVVRKSGLPKNLSRSITKISRPSSKSLSKMMGKPSKSLSRNTGKLSESLPKGIGKPSQMLSKSVSMRSLTKLKGVKAFSKKKIPKSLNSILHKRQNLKFNGEERL